GDGDGAGDGERAPGAPLDELPHPRGERHRAVGGGAQLGAGRGLQQERLGALGLRARGRVPDAAPLGEAVDARPGAPPLPRTAPRGRPPPAGRTRAPAAAPTPSRPRPLTRAKPGPARAMTTMKRMAADTTAPAQGPSSARAISASDRPPRRTEAASTSMSCTAP